MTGAARQKPEPGLVVDAARLAASVGCFAVFGSVNGHAQAMVAVRAARAEAGPLDGRAPETGGVR